MSTAIFGSGNSGHQGPNPFALLNPVQIYLALSLPLTAVTLLVWGGLHLLEMRREKQRKREHKESGWQV